MRNLFALEESIPDPSLLYRPRGTSLRQPQSRWQRTRVTSKMSEIRIRGLSIVAGRSERSNRADFVRGVPEGATFTSILFVAFRCFCLEC